MSRLDMLEEFALLSLLGALAFSYVLDRLHLSYYGHRARKIVDDLYAMERRLSAASKRLISWRESPIERLIIGAHIDTLLFQYERAGAMTTRLTALIRVRSTHGRR